MEVRCRWWSWVWGVVGAFDGVGVVVVGGGSELSLGVSGTITGCRGVGVCFVEVRCELEGLGGGDAGGGVGVGVGSSRLGGRRWGVWVGSGRSRSKS